MTPETTTPAVRVRRRDACPDVAELRRLLGDALGAARATQAHLAELVGCSLRSIIRWEQGERRPSAGFRPRLLELERKLRARALSIDDELARGTREPELRAGRTLPLVADVVSVDVEGDRALLRFGLKVPGEPEPRTVVEVLVSRWTAGEAFGTRVG